MLLAISVFVSDVRTSTPNLQNHHKTCASNGGNLPLQIPVLRSLNLEMSTIIVERSVSGMRCPFFIGSDIQVPSEILSTLTATHKDMLLREFGLGL